MRKYSPLLLVAACVVVSLAFSYAALTAKPERIGLGIGHDAHKAR